MNWYTIWTAWLLCLIASFAVLEGYALYSNGLTLSRFTWIVTKDWPLMPWLCGVLAGGLAVHFFWTNQGLGQ